MFFKFDNKKISGILSVIPKNEVSYEEEMENYTFPIAQSLKLKMAMGYNKHCIVEDDVCVSDLCVHGVRYLLDENLINKDDISAIVLVTQTPDYFLPATSNVIHGELGLGQDVICMDINQGCAGYIQGLFQSFMLLEQESVKKVLLLNADVLSRKVSKQDRNSNPLIGDGASVTVVERTDNENKIYGFLKTDGSGANALMIPAGGLRKPCTDETGKMIADCVGNIRSEEHLIMNGTEVFNFVQREVPIMVDELLAYSGSSKEEIDWYMFHQPNKFMLQKLADGMGVSREKVPANIVENFGNSSGATIPTNIAFNLGDDLKDKACNMCLAGFGVGLTWASLQMNIGNLEFNKIIRF